MKIFYMNMLLLVVGVDTQCYSGECSHPSEQEWVSCDLCDGWFHCRCVGVTLHQAGEEDFDFICSLCSCY